ncbi:SPOR domain-containing protein [Massilia horti]|uniref:SPOR domain-containing protein n=1 Tax=Massilia horti TaxID=2562153 RepID=A0A4Y9SXP5_9BURK|nr:SPOR domain-containing protein [Massilia horti]TFW29984.1 SPOR domain-containing protein [Massilia horti]
MLKFVFWSLLGLNAILFAYAQGYLGTVNGNEHEPARMKNQLAADKFKLLSASEAQLAAGAQEAQTASTPEPAPAATEPAPAAPGPARPAVALVACTEVGSFTLDESRRFERRLARLNLGEHQTRRGVPAQDVTSYLVYVPPQGSKEAAERKTAELRALGVENSFILSVDSPFKWGISLGVFKSEASAQTMLATLTKQGVRDARVAPRGPMSTHFVYQFRDIDAGTRGKIAALADSFDAAEVKACR